MHFIISILTIFEYWQRDKRAAAKEENPNNFKLHDDQVARRLSSTIRSPRYIESKMFVKKPIAIDFAFS